MDYCEGDYLAIRFVGHTPEYSDFLRSCFLNRLIFCASVDVDNPHIQRYTITIQLTAEGVNRIDKLIHDFSGSVLFRGKSIR